MDSNEFREVSGVSPDRSPQRNCPYCGEVILEIARKCKHCGEFLDHSMQESRTASQAKIGMRVVAASFGIAAVCILVALAMYVVSGIGSNVLPHCTVNGLGSGSCEFMNEGWSPGEACARVAVINLQGDEATSVVSRYNIYNT